MAKHIDTNAESVCVCVVSALTKEMNLDLPQDLGVLPLTFKLG